MHICRAGEELIEILCKVYKRVCEDKEKLPSKGCKQTSE